MVSRWLARAERAAVERAAREHTPVVSPFDWRACLAAAVVGLVSGGLAVLFRSALAGTERIHDTVASALGAHGALGWIGLVALAAAMGALGRLLVDRFAPETAGSGIPGVEARLGVEQPMRWRRILPVKFAGGIAALGTGMSLGREGPTVQMGAAIGEAIGEWTRREPRLRKALVAAGAGAGLTGAFDAPIAGFLFVIEELRWEISALTYTTGLIATLSAQLVIQTIIGPAPLFGKMELPLLSVAGFVAAAACGLLCGLVGVLYNRSILLALDSYGRWRSVPTWVHGALAGAIAVAIGYFVPGAIFGGDPIAGSLTRGDVAEIVHTQTAGSPYGHLPALAPWLVLLVIAAAKLFVTAASYGSGVVGGLFAPQLVIGATVGTMVAVLVEPWMPGATLAVPLAGAGAIAVFAASVRVPVTGVVLMLEMTGDAGQALPWAIAAALGFLVATALGNEPIYEALGKRASGSVPEHDR
jgi:chloride channel protein, CIC family